METTDDNLEIEGRPNGSRPVRLGGALLDERCHVCAFFSSRDDEYRVLLPFIKDGLAGGEKIVHTVDPVRLEDHLQRLASAGIDVAASRHNGQFDLFDWTQTHLLGGRFDQDRTLSLFGEIKEKAEQQGFPMVRIVSHMEWAVESRTKVDVLLEYEARANSIWLERSGPAHPVICTYDINRFSGDVIVDIMRTHPMVIIGGILQENPFFVPPDRFLDELHHKQRAAQTT